MLLAELAQLQPDDSRTFVDARRAPEYRRGHIPGAIHLDTFPHANEDTSARAMPELEQAWARMFAAAGLTFERPVVFYDQGTENMAARPALMLRYLGHPDVRVLHGGMRAWLAAGHDISRTPRTLPPVAARTLPIVPRKDMVVGVDAVSAALAGGAKLLDVRATPEFAGWRRVQWNPRMGNIPGARHIQWTELLENERDYDPRIGTPRFRTHVLSRFKPDAEIVRMLGEAGISKDDELIVYCQKSHRASNAFLALERAGFSRARIYAGSFREWSRRTDLPVERQRRKGAV